ncbi:PAB1-binding protein 2 [Teratosphaeria destructans]|uniref:PAB1-binding protein 2 n=1 Tax=Teratosphaeria destructans TaxID=418781 RepID=A0A9W7W115_9PEZI|nr:PAB1-binding protein 2 [Teratosphaeria destructans]
MAEAPIETPATATQKRPLEEPSSPSGPTDQPDAKRPALDKLLKEDGSLADGAAATDGALADVAQANVTKPEVKGEAAATTESKAELVVTDKQGDTVVPDAPLTGTESTSVGAGSAPRAHSIATNGHHDGRAGSQGPYHHQDETNWLHMRAIISSPEAATVIGKGGENVSQIRRMAGAKCTVSEYNRGAVERILTVSGPVDAVAKAFGLIIRTLNQEPLDQPSTPQSKTYPLRLLIPHILIGSIIGKQGVRIREIQEASGARLNASESCLPLSTERSLVVLGVADAVHIATYYVGSTLVEQLTDRFGGPAASNYASRHGGPQGVVPGGMQVVPYVPQHAGGQMGHPDTYRKHPNHPGGPPQRAPSGPYGMPYGQGPPQPHGPGPYGASSPRAPSIGAGPAGPYGPQPPHPAGAVGPHPAGPYPPHAGGPPNPAHAGPPQQPMQIPGQPITQQIFIPNDMVGAIIGKGGAKINEIRQLSGSVIKINEPTDNNNERLVTITGTQECNQMALYMLYSSKRSGLFLAFALCDLLRGAIWASEAGNLDSPLLTPVWYRRLPPFATRQNSVHRARLSAGGNISRTRGTAMASLGRPLGVPVMEMPSPTASETSLSTQQDGPQQRQTPDHMDRTSRQLQLQTQQQQSRSRSRARRSPSRLPLRTAFRNFSGVAEVIVGDDSDRSRPKTRFMVHKELLTAASPFFDAALNSTFAEGMDNQVKLPEEKPDSFEWFLQWLYTGSLTSPHARFDDGPDWVVAGHRNHTLLDPASGRLVHGSGVGFAVQQYAEQMARSDGDLRNHQGSPKYFLLIDLFALSDRLLTTQLSNHILSTIARLSEATNSVPTPSDTWILYDSIPDGSKLRTLVLDLFAYKKTDRLLETHKDEWHPRFLRELVVKLKRPGPEAIERHCLEPWSPKSWSQTRACEGCKETLKPLVSVDKCAMCEKAFCAGCLRRHGDPSSGGVASLSHDASGCKPWMGPGMCRRYHEHAEGESCLGLGM